MSTNSDPSAYNQAFYQDRNASTQHAAERILDAVFAILPEILSAADIGCGVGTWLSILRKRGVKNIRGFDGSWVSKDLLEIPNDLFTEYDLTTPIKIGERYDLAISLEVAEHLPEQSADTFIDSLTGLSDFVLFSAAIPHQGGVNHVNEQWQSYWAAKFAERGYLAIDAIRPKVWSDQKISIPYRQNAILYVKDNRIGELSAQPSDIGSLSAAHPELYLIRNSKSVMQSLRDLKMTVMKKLFGAKFS
jgi:SAM-dependent methyltransferase